MTSVFATDTGALAAGFVAVAVGATADAELLIAPLAAGFAARAFADGLAGRAFTTGFVAAFAAGFVAAFAAGFAAGFAGVGAALAALGATLAAADRVAFGALDRVDLRLGAVADRCRVAPDPDPVAPVDVSSAIAFSSGGTPVHCPSAPTRPRSAVYRWRMRSASP